MLSQEIIREITKKYQTLEKNVAREYIQHLFLSFLYQEPASEQILFKGGTALRIIFGSPRFSEDLDFSGLGLSQRDVDAVFLNTLSKLERYGIGAELVEAKKTSGGYLGILTFKLYGHLENIRFEVSFRDKVEKGETTTIVSDFLPAYLLRYLEESKLVGEKLSALRDRGKPRDWYDLYFILRHGELRRYANKKALSDISKILGKTDINFKTELSIFLPLSHHLILKDFKANLQKELAKYL